MLWNEWISELSNQIISCYVDDWGRFQIDILREPYIRGGHRSQNGKLFFVFQW